MRNINENINLRHLFNLLMSNDYHTITLKQHLKLACSVSCLTQSFIVYCVPMCQRMKTMKHCFIVQNIYSRNNDNRKNITNGSVFQFGSPGDTEKTIKKRNTMLRFLSHSSISLLRFFFKSYFSLKRFKTIKSSETSCCFNFQ